MDRRDALKSIVMAGTTVVGGLQLAKASEKINLFEQDKYLQDKYLQEFIDFHSSESNEGVLIRTDAGLHFYRSEEKLTKQETERLKWECPPKLDCSNIRFGLLDEDECGFTRFCIVDYGSGHLRWRDIQQMVYGQSKLTISQRGVKTFHQMAGMESWTMYVSGMDACAIVNMYYVQRLQ